MSSENIKKILKEELAVAGLDIAEEAAVKAFKAVMKAAPKIAAETATGVDDLLVQVLPFVEPKVLALLDGIDGQVG
jgi:hypothetical protein